MSYRRELIHSIFSTFPPAPNNIVKDVMKYMTAGGAFTTYLYVEIQF